MMRHNFAGLSRSYILFQRWTCIAKNLRLQHHQVRNLKIWNQRPKPTARSMNRMQPPQRITVQELLTKYHLKLDPSHNTTFSKLQDLALKIVETLTICLIIHKKTESEGIITIPLLHNNRMQWFLLRPQNIFGMCLRLSLHIKVVLKQSVCEVNNYNLLCNICIHTDMSHAECGTTTLLPMGTL